MSIFFDLMKSSKGRWAKGTFGVVPLVWCLWCGAFGVWVQRRKKMLSVLPSCPKQI